MALFSQNLTDLMLALVSALVAVSSMRSAYADQVAADIESLDVEAVAKEAVDAMRRRQPPRALAPGTYEVVLAPYAVADIVTFLATELTGLAVEDGHSFVGGGLGTRVAGDSVTLVDDPHDPCGLPRACDFEGVPSTPLTLIDRGVARAIAYDSQTAARHGVPNTGHAVPLPLVKVLPMHLRLEAGPRSLRDLIAGVRQGIFVTRFWYTRWVHPLRTIVTGTTRDGTFAIERGEIADPVRDLRFTQSYHEALGGVMALGRTLKLQRLEPWGFDAASLRVPALHLAGFLFMGATGP